MALNGIFLNNKKRRKKHKHYKFVLLGVCQCSDGYHGDDCSVAMDTAPTIVALSEDVYSVTGDNSLPVSRQVFVYGSSFVNSVTLTCHLTEVMVSIVILH